MQASPARTDGPIYDLPEGIGQEIVCGERNREYLLLTTGRAACSSCRTSTRTASRRSCRRPRTQRSRPVWSGFFYSTSNTNTRLTTNTCICSPTEQLVEARRIELRSILYYPSGSTSLSRYRNSEPVGQRANVRVPSRFDLYRSHTVHVLRCSPLK